MACPVEINGKVLVRRKDSNHPSISYSWHVTLHHPLFFFFQLSKHFESSRKGVKGGEKDIRKERVKYRE